MCLLEGVKCFEKKTKSTAGQGSCCSYNKQVVRVVHVNKMQFEPRFEEGGAIRWSLSGGNTSQQRTAGPTA